jgi:hypothetical protein
MSVSSGKTRVVFFRVTQQEFDEVMVFCRKRKIRSISDLARSGVRRILEEAQEVRSPECRQLCVLSLQNEIAALRVELDRLLGMLNAHTAD